MPDRDIELLLTSIDQAYDHESWHGTNLKGSIRRLSAVEAAWRPDPGRHNIHELVVHAAYWKYAVRRRLTGEPRGSFPLEGSNWFERPSEPDERQWKADRKLLDETHLRLREAIADVDPRYLEQVPEGSKTTTLDTILGVAAHDLYHAGQIQLLKRLQKEG